MSSISRELPPEALRLGRFHAEHPVGSPDYRRALFGSALMVATCAAMMVVATRAKDTAPSMSWLSCLCFQALSSGAC